MKLKIKPASQVILGGDLPSEPPVEEVILHWLNTEVWGAIQSAEPEYSKPKNGKVTVKARVVEEVPMEYYSTKNDFVRITKAHLVPLGYDVEFTHDGVGNGDICIISWETNLGVVTKGK